MIPQRSIKGKGKARVEPSESDPLLPSSSSSAAPLTAPSGRWGQHRGRSILATALIVIASLVLTAILFLALLVSSFNPSEKELDLLSTTAFTYLGPDDVRILNITDDGILVQVSLRCGVDVDDALGLYRFKGAAEKDEAIASGTRGTGAEWWEELRRWVAYRVLDQLPTKTIEVNVTDPMTIYTGSLDSLPLLSMTILDNLTIPLVTGVDRNLSWLQPLTFTALAKPIASTGQLWEFVQHAWTAGEAKVVINIRKVQAKIPESVWWARYGRGEKEELCFSTGLPGKLSVSNCLILVPHPFLISM
jgi:hypothetical protein